MARASRYISQNLTKVHVVLELVDARLPAASRHRWLARRWTQKAHVVVMTRADLADPDVTQLWRRVFVGQGSPVLAVDLIRATSRALLAGVMKALPSRIESRMERGSTVRVMVVGLPNVGKSTLINVLSGRGGAASGRQPGVTRGQQWIRVSEGLRLLDLPGILPPDSVRQQDDWYRLAAAGLVPPQAADVVATVLWLLDYLLVHYPAPVVERYGLTEPLAPCAAAALEAAGRRLGCLKAGGVVDQERAATRVLLDYQEGRLGRASLQSPEAETL